MAVHETLLWQLRIVREFLALTAPKVSLSCFWWSKPPGNAYITFYPTAWLRSDPERDAPGEGPSGPSIFRRSTGASEGSRGLTLGDYGTGTLLIPGWASNGADADPVVCDARRHRDPSVAARRMRNALDVEWLAREGDVDPATTSRVLRWLDEAIALGQQPSIDGFGMRFEETGRLSDLERFEFYDSATDRPREVVWPAREPSADAVS